MLIASMTVKFNHLFRTGKAAHDRMDAVVRKVAKDVQEETRIRAVKDTSAMSRSVYVSGRQYSDYGERVADALTVMPKMVRTDEEKPDAPLTYAIGVAAGHGIYNELGTSKMAPRPFLLPAFQAKVTATTLAAEIKKAFKGIVP